MLTDHLILVGEGDDVGSRRRISGLVIRGTGVTAVVLAAVGESSTVGESVTVGAGSTSSGSIEPHPARLAPTSSAVADAAASLFFNIVFSPSVCSIPGWGSSG
ncbi:MAG: hypothetical protein Q4G67_00780 [Actinomycetia bacterium]|nr:hypothetical protein [Actinomycetes bacterium]